MAKALLWLSFDLGIRGDFEGMYQFLDTYNAKECGDSVAIFEYDFNNDLLLELKRDIENLVKVDKRTRVYVVYPKEGKLAGRFIIGRRKFSPWTGFGLSSHREDEEDVSG